MHISLGCRAEKTDIRRTIHFRRADKFFFKVCEKNPFAAAIYDYETVNRASRMLLYAFLSSSELLEKWLWSVKMKRENSNFQSLRFAHSLEASQLIRIVHTKKRVHTSIKTEENDSILKEQLVSLGHKMLTWSHDQSDT